MEDLKKAAAEKAVEQVESGMILGLGSGSTSNYATIHIGNLYQAGKLMNIFGVPTSEGTAALARKYELPLATLDEQPVIDLAIDGADEVDPDLNLIKGLGGALLREKMVDVAATRFIVIVDESKLVTKLGTRSPLPVEVVQFGWRAQARWLELLGCTPVLRGGQENPFITDNGNFILDCAFPQGIDEPLELDATLKNWAGIVENGLFLNMASEVIIAESNGLRVMK